MKKLLLPILCGAVALTSTLAASGAYAGDGDGLRHYAVTITNTTRGQILSPVAVIVHDDNYRLFSLGSPASPELAMLAEEGSADMLLASAGGMHSVYKTAAATGVLKPGASETVEIETNSRFSRISAAAMLVSSNDAFMAVRDIEAPNRGNLAVDAIAYDAGSEANSENCAYVPGPPCGGHVHDPAPAEGYVYVHAGIHGIGGLTPSVYDWRGPVAHIEIKRID
ncbi:MAG TPA: spondin domain-containing protein [Burkholderiales bacterium]|nr:spondin domain-containing protein [Burkholderiales bacterium]